MIRGTGTSLAGRDQWSPKPMVRDSRLRFCHYANKGRSDQGRRAAPPAMTLRTGVTKVKTGRLIVPPCKEPPACARGLTVTVFDSVMEGRYRQQQWANGRPRDDLTAF